MYARPRPYGVHVGPIGRSDLDRSAGGCAQFLITASSVMELASRAGELFAGSKVEDKRHLLSLLVSNLELEGEKLHFKLKAPFDAIAGCSKNNIWLLRSGSNRRPIR